MKQYKAIGWVVMNKHSRRWWPCGSVCSTQTIARNSYELNEGVSFNRGFAAGHTKCVQVFVEVKP